MSLLEEAKFLLRKYHIVPKKRLSQHFLIEPAIFNMLADYASLTSADTVLDIGAGLGFLTLFLARRCKMVLAVELDSRLVKILRENLGDLPNIIIFEGDILGFNMISPFNKVVSVPPYGISSKLVEWLFNRDFASAVLILQKEFADRLVAPVGSESYGWLSVLSYYHFEVDVLDDVPNSMFYPPPKVNSVIVRLRPRGPAFPIQNYQLFYKLVHFLFSQRNKKVRNAIKQFLKKHLALSEDVIKLTESLPFRNRRVRELAPEDFGELVNVLSN
jgi:16S rRNA (adenine1518-N6/adenine1519-N6)-dimethyltransferase